MTSKDPLNLAIVSAIVSALAEHEVRVFRAQEVIVSAGKYTLPFYTGNNDLTPRPDLTPTLHLCQKYKVASCPHQLATSRA